jgi:hypothetical protein
VTVNGYNLAWYERSRMHLEWLTCCAELGRHAGPVRVRPRPASANRQAYGATWTCVCGPLQMSGTFSGRIGAASQVTTILNQFECGWSET